MLLGHLSLVIVSLIVLERSLIIVSLIVAFAVTVSQTVSDVTVMSAMAVGISSGDTT